MGRVFKITVIVLGLACILAAGEFLPGLNRMRREHRLTAGEPLSNAPPELVLTTTALAGMRGIFVDILWMRAIKMEEQGKYFELVQLYDWIGKLEPRFPTVWRFAAWNMAYNISKTLTTPLDRWRWINRGIELLRDKGFRYNHDEPEIYRELAQIYSHRIGSRFDLFHRQFKAYFAEEMQDALGPAQDVRGMAAAPRSRDILLRDPAVRALLALLRQHDVDPFKQPLAFANGRVSMPEALKAALGTPENKAAVQKLGLFLRAFYLRDVMKLEPTRMVALMYGPAPEGYGPMDWRLPYPHAIYWTRMAQRVARSDQQEMNDNRQIQASMLRLLEGGKLYFEPATRNRRAAYYTEYEWHFIPRLNQLYLDTIEHSGGEEVRGIRNAHALFLEEAVEQLYIAGQMAEAQRYFAELRKRYPGTENKKPLKEFVESRIKKRLGEASSGEVKGMVNSLLRRAYIAMAFRDVARARGLARIAKAIYEEYVESYRKLGTKPEIPPFNDLQHRAFLLVVRSLAPQMAEELQRQLAVPPPPEEKKDEKKP